MSILLTKKLERGARELESFIFKARRKLLEFEVLQSQIEINQGKGKVYRRASEFMKSLRRA
mgnify:CR=1 FL=1